MLTSLQERCHLARNLQHCDRLHECHCKVSEDSRRGVVAVGNRVHKTHCEVVDVQRNQFLRLVLVAAAASTVLSNANTAIPVAANSSAAPAAIVASAILAAAPAANGALAAAPLTSIASAVSPAQADAHATAPAVPFLIDAIVPVLLFAVEIAVAVPSALAAALAAPAAVTLAGTSDALAVNSGGDALLIAPAQVVGQMHLHMATIDASAAGDAAIAPVAASVPASTSAPAAPVGDAERVAGSRRVMTVATPASGIRLALLHAAIVGISFLEPSGCSACPHNY